MAGRGDLGRAQALLACVLVAAAGAASGSAAQERLGLALVADGLRQPVQVVSAPGEPGRLYVVERAGRARVVEDGRVLPDAFFDIRPRVRSGGLLGMLSIAFHPRYPATRRLYAMFTAAGGAVVVAELRTRAGRARLARLLLCVVGGG